MVIDTKKILDEITNRLVKELKPERIYLFGSYAYGSPSPHSDMDFLIVVPETTERIIDLQRRARKSIGYVDCGVDVIVRTESDFEHRASWPSNLEATIKSKGKLLYG